MANIIVKAKVLIPFTDKHTGKKYEKVGEIIDISAKRFNEITSKDKLIELVEEEEATTKK